MNSTIVKIIQGALGLLIIGAVIYFVTPFFTGKKVQEDIPQQVVMQKGEEDTSKQMVVKEVVTMETQKVVSSETASKETVRKIDTPEVKAEIKPEIKKEVDTTTTSYAVVGTSGHPASGSVRIIKTDSSQFVRYENFKTINGPDLFVYLAKDLKAKDFVSLGKLKATEGNINYEIPQGVNVADYPYVMVWCEDFSVLFNYAKLGN